MDPPLDVQEEDLHQDLTSLPSALVLLVLGLLAPLAHAQTGAARAQFNRGTCLPAANETERAIGAYEAAIAADPAMAEAHFRLGALLVGQNRVPEAIAHLEKYLALAPADAATARKLLEAIRK